MNERLATFAESLAAREGGGMVAAWIGMADPMLANHLAQEDFDCVVFDMQHGLLDVQTAAAGVAQVLVAGKPALARIPVGDNASASRLLDAGVCGIIAPMINERADAEALVAATKFPPLGARSWGPVLAMNHFGMDGPDYLARANAMCVTIAMIETREAFANMDEIVSLEGIDGIFIGPSDLSIALADGARVAAVSPEIDEAMRRAADCAGRHGKIVSAFGADGARARYLLDLGFHLVTAGGDSGQLRAGARAEIRAARGG